MATRIRIELDTVESLLFFWKQVNEREKVNELYIIGITEMQGFKDIYEDEFSAESVRRVLSAVTNKEILSGINKKEGRFWNNNLWMLEDLEYADAMSAPIKQLNLDFLLPDLTSLPFDEVIVEFVPGHQFEYKIKKNKLIINFFKVMPDLTGSGLQPTIEGKEIKAYIAEKIAEMK